MSWYERFRNVTAYLRQRGWRWSFILFGDVLQVPGIVHVDVMRKFSFTANR